MFSLDFIFDGSTEPIRARAIEEALLDQSTGQCVECGNTARARNCAAADPAARLDSENKADTAADSRLPEHLWIVARSNLAGNLLEIGTA